MLRQYPVLRQKRGRTARLWREAIEETLSEYRANGEPAKAELLLLRYVEGSAERAMPELLHISRKTYYQYKRDVLCTAAFYAARRGLL